ncbi:hypothetical protein OKA05_20870 [Luteolibacter arcticus]|uniref:DUF5666 domain-containing protein n=1 Tax=Luteolibacter arcticus TaxID=1581411 RepID=A0ABT3GNE0_9BACT|nr:hypothetical protein [Luteolibacter arcticus]MCW1925027.1 hypothetical protein [Luteolibacter arcticus]
MVTFTDDAGLAFIADDTGGVYVDSTPPGLKQGDAVAVRGVTAPGRSVTIIDGPENAAPEMKVIGCGLLPEPLVIPPGKVADLAFNGQWTALTGRVLRVSHAGGRAVVELDAAGQRVRGGCIAAGAISRRASPRGSRSGGSGIRSAAARSAC